MVKVPAAVQSGVGHEQESPLHEDTDQDTTTGTHTGTQAVLRLGHAGGAAGSESTKDPLTAALLSANEQRRAALLEEANSPGPGSVLLLWTYHHFSHSPGPLTGLSK